MDYMSNRINNRATANNTNQYYDQSYTYSHYYQNKRPYISQSSQSNSLNQQQNKNQPTRNKQAYPSNQTPTQNQSYQNRKTYQSNNSDKKSNFRNIENSSYSHSAYSNHSKKSFNNTQKHNISQFEDNNDNLLLNDVYGKNSTSTSNEKTDNIDFSSLFQSFFNANSESNENVNSSNNANSFNMPDIEMILKCKKILEKMNSKNGQNTPLVNLLYAIKPFMQDSKKSIIDQLAKFLTISTLLQDFNDII